MRTWDEKNFDLKEILLDINRKIDYIMDTTRQLERKINEVAK